MRHVASNSEEPLASPAGGPFGANRRIFFLWNAFRTTRFLEGAWVPALGWVDGLPQPSLIRYKLA